MSGTPDRAEIRHRRRAEAVQVLAGLAWLVLALAVFWAPLAFVLRPAVGAIGLDSFLHGSAPGFMLQITSEPPGGQLWVNNADRGTLPVIANISCQEGQPVRIQVSKDGFSPWRRDIGCREGQTLTVTARLGR